MNIKTEYVGLLDQQVQNEIRYLVITSLLELGTSADELDQMVENAMSGRISDLEELVDSDTIDSLVVKMERKIELRNVTFELIDQKMLQKRGRKNYSNEDVVLITQAKELGNWAQVYCTKFYREHSGDYCTMLEILSRYSITYEDVR